MVILFAGLLCLLPANRAYSLDALLFPRWRSETVPRWSVWALRTQMEIILIYAGLVKITEDWLKLEPLGTWLRAMRRRRPFGLGELLYYDWVIALGAYGTIVLHLLGAPLLLFKRTRLPTFIVYCVFHSVNAFFFNIGIFPWLTIAATTIFFEPDWPRRFAAIGRSAASGRCRRCQRRHPAARRALSWANALARRRAAGVDGGAGARPAALPALSGRGALGRGGASLRLAHAHVRSRGARLLRGGRSSERRAVGGRADRPSDRAAGGHDADATRHDPAVRALPGRRMGGAGLCATSRSMRTWTCR